MARWGACGSQECGGGAGRGRHDWGQGCRGGRFVKNVDVGCVCADDTIVEDGVGETSNLSLPLVLNSADVVGEKVRQELVDEVIDDAIDDNWEPHGDFGDALNHCRLK